MRAQGPEGDAIETPTLSAESALALVRPASTDFNDIRLTKLWLAIRRKPWRSLAVVAGSTDISTIEISNTLAKMAWSYLGRASCVVDCRDLSLRLVEYQLREVGAYVDEGRSVIVSLRSIAENPATIAIAGALEAAVLCVRLGESSIASALQAIQEIGRPKFIGSIVLGQSLSPRSGQARKAG
jgi:hypothetical protein